MSKYHFLIFEDSLFSILQPYSANVLNHKSFEILSNSNKNPTDSDKFFLSINFSIYSHEFFHNL